MPTKRRMGAEPGHELTLLLSCARTTLDDATRVRVHTLIDTGIDWAAFYRLARHHWLTTLCLRTLQRIAPDRVPADIMQGLNASAQEMTWHGLLLLGELCKVMAHFNAHDVQAIPFKGPVLSALAYGDPVARFSGDLDILVQEPEIPRTRQLLVELGYESNSTTVLRDAPETAVHKVYHHELFTHTASGVVVELHWKVDECEFIRPFDPVFSPNGCCPTRLTLGGTEMRVLSPECLLLLLCEHGAKHRWWQLRWVSDIAELIRRSPAMDWAQASTSARETGNQRVFWLGLLLAHELLDAPVPMPLLRRARADHRISQLADEVRHGLGVLDDYIDIRLDVLLFHIRAKERPRDRVKLFWHFTMVPAEADWTTVALPPALSFLYCIIRPLRLLQRYGSVCVKQLWRLPS